MRMRAISLLTLLACAANDAANAQSAKYPPIEQYLMPRDSEIALARSAALPSFPSMR